MDAPPPRPLLGPALEAQREKIFDAFGLDEEQREFIRSDLDGYQAAREAADAARAVFAEDLRARALAICDDVLRTFPR